MGGIVIHDAILRGDGVFTHEPGLFAYPGFYVGFSRKTGRTRMIIGGLPARWLCPAEPAMGSTSLGGIVNLSK